MAHSRSARGRTKTASRGASAHGSSQTRSQRQLRVGEELRHVLAELLARDELRDPHLTGVNLPVPEVRASPDPKSPPASVVPRGGGDPEPVIAALNPPPGFLRTKPAREGTPRSPPRMPFPTPPPDRK